MMKNIMKLVATTALLMGFSSACGAAWADNNSSEVRLVATIDNSPAFQPVKWEIYRVDDPTRKIKKKRHSFTLKSMSPGRYRAIVRRPGNKKEHTRDFFVMADTTSRVHVPLD